MLLIWKCQSLMAKTIQLNGTEQLHNGCMSRVEERIQSFVLAKEYWRSSSEYFFGQMHVLEAGKIFCKFFA